MDATSSTLKVGLVCYQRKCASAMLTLCLLLPPVSMSSMSHLQGST